MLVCDNFTESFLYRIDLILRLDVIYTSVLQ